MLLGIEIRGILYYLNYVTGRMLWMVCVHGNRGRWGTPLMGTRSVAARLAANAEEYSCGCRLFTVPFLFPAEAKDDRLVVFQVVAFRNLVFRLV